jgi:hypothetical protein
MLHVTRDWVLQKVRQLFPSLNPDIVMEVLDLYGTESYERERERVQLAILKLSEGSQEKLLQFLDVAKLDYRDVLAWAEYPNAMRLSVAATDGLDEQGKRALAEGDLQQYLAWLQPQSLLHIDTGEAKR